MAVAAFLIIFAPLTEQIERFAVNEMLFNNEPSFSAAAAAAAQRKP